MVIEFAMPTYLFAALLVVNILFAVILIFIERKDAQATWAWLLILFFIPLVGFIIYILLGQTLTRRKIFQWEGIKKVGLDHLIEQQKKDVLDANFRFKSNTVDENRDLIYMHLMNNDAILTKENHIDIFTDGEKKFNQLLTDIRNAKTFIHIQYYIFRYDGIGKEIIDALTEKAKEGVRVRLLYDDLGSRSMRKKYLKAFREAGGEVGVFFPSRFTIVNLRLNFRNHRKLVNIDGVCGYVGGFNVGDEYLGKKKKFGYWRDTHLRIEGPALAAIQTRFILDWNQAAKEYHISYHSRYFPDIPPNGQSAMQIVSSGPDSEFEQIKNGYLKMIMDAKKSIIIQTPYFIPDKTLLDALQVAAQTGIEVKIMIPNKPDHMFVYWATTSHIGEMLKVGAKIYIYENGFIHNKVLVVDERVSSVGTANIDQRSFKLNFEVNAFIYDSSIARQLIHDFAEDVNVSTLVTTELYEARGKRVRFKESISRLLSPIL
ncbi:cardiolipin synthase [Shouchella lehensis]|uniref:Cardiolipin synthase n=2 Tax=Shouchella lehensis TaxID=300825 RepID=A0A060M3L0_9BACI|nr:cardiolipin synthase [Shouchella lehensis]AIC94674.1 cardiolipin synthase [Shouchella lehensis G1]RQW20536.1 cardiolipin synthase [Bacillus sp. C1-1]TES50549.1 cardiolipin synthase [Shouchella lehensis]